MCQQADFVRSVLGELGSVWSCFALFLRTERFLDMEPLLLSTSLKVVSLFHDKPSLHTVYMQNPNAMLTVGKAMR